MGSVGLWTLFRRESIRFLREWKSTLTPSLITNALYIIVFGGILGGRLEAIQGFAYIDFILPGIIILGAVMNAFNNTSFSIFHARWDDYIHEILTSPMSYWEMLTAYIGAAIARGVLVGVGIFGVALFFTDLALLHPFVFAAFLFLSSALFAFIGIIIGLWAREFNDLSMFSNFLITPLVFLGGVFYSLEMLPAVWTNVSYFNPMVYMVNGLRYGMIGYTDIGIGVAALVLIGFVAAAFVVSLQMFRNGYGLRE